MVARASSLRTGRLVIRISQPEGLKPARLYFSNRLKAGTMQLRGERTRFACCFGGSPKTPFHQFPTHRLVRNKMIKRGVWRAAKHGRPAACAPHFNCIVPAKKPFPSFPARPNPHGPPFVPRVLGIW